MNDQNINIIICAIVLLLIAGVCWAVHEHNEKNKIHLKTLQDLQAKYDEFATTHTQEEIDALGEKFAELRNLKFQGLIDDDKLQEEADRAIRIYEK
jgi:hypothetical protein